MAVNETGGIRKYITLLETNPQEAQALCQEILIGVTSFFRDPEAFEVIKREVFPAFSPTVTLTSRCVSGTPAAPPAKRFIRSQS